MRACLEESPGSEARVVLVVTPPEERDSARSVAKRRWTVNHNAYEAIESNLRMFDDGARRLAGALTRLRSAHRARLARSANDETRPTLTGREVAILRLIAAGADNAAIASELHFGLGTVKLHVREILETLEVPTRAAAAARAVRLGLI